jgi:predicted DNA-binding transcriptional regulator AlpA
MAALKPMPYLEKPMPLQGNLDNDRVIANDRVLTFFEWCDLIGVSPATGRRLINAGSGPTITRLSPRRIGITVANNRAWLESRARSI